MGRSMYSALLILFAVLEQAYTARVQNYKQLKVA